MPSDKLTFVLTRRDWLPRQWRSLIFWGAFTALWVVAVAALSRLSPWFLLLFIPAWLHAGHRLFGLLLFLLRGTARMTILLPSEEAGHQSVGASSNGGKSVTPIEDAHLKDCGSVWLLIGRGGRIQIVIPKNSLSLSQQAMLLDRLPLRT